MSVCAPKSPNPCLPPESPSNDNDRPAKRQAGWKRFVLLPVGITFLGAGYIFWQGRTESVQEGDEDESGEGEQKPAPQAG